ncbi:PqqD family protein [Granulicella sp. S156]|uniref:PqqD family protein n=1 Tax=Granulicella sp. S156 TaxID=1747224 RepID=UPI00131ACB7F|nr:PqqD family protein [Granulicella sp. S156]
MSLPLSELSTVVNQDGAAILDVSRNQITTLNSTGGFIWDRLQKGLTAEQAIQELATETQTDPAIVERGVRAFLEQLKSEGLLSR